ncbi:DUF3394 domain-containing protein [Brevibacillus massiliensis]|jgi:TRAP-type uncharacterized transport system fused permease subunit|uniref:DUF3394 domain-containing protein n=1 Tax=Brevibacillus massiliensis TaxID=1118054 RepID=UPI0002F53121|nr:DUF3394 domain-containing protein [Brevibacillus massiliensis]
MGVSPLAAFAGASIAGTEPMRTGLAAMKLGIAGFIVPFMFVYAPSLLLQGSMAEIVLTLITASVGIFILASVVEGWWMRRLKAWERILLLVGALALIKPGIYTDLLGLAILILVYLNQRLNVPPEPASHSTVNE